MAIAYCVLASGSGGNCLWLGGGGVEVLVDCGLSARQIEQRLAAVGKSAKDLRALVCTHAHVDHVAGAAVLSRRYDLDIFATAATLRGIPGGPPRERLCEMPRKGSIAIDGLEVRTTPTPHDAPGSVALVLGDSQGSLGVVTDLGRPTDELARSLSGVDGLVLESNHDSEMLRRGPYPEWLKRRIRSNAGHLSNDQSADFLTGLLHPGLQHLTLAHLSETNNSPALAADRVTEVLAAVGASAGLAVAEQHRPGEPVALVPAAPRSVESAQLSLPYD